MCYLWDLLSVHGMNPNLAGRADERCCSLHFTYDAELLRENKRMLDKAIRDLDRERAGLQLQEKKLIMEIKKMAKQNQMVRRATAQPFCCGPPSSQPPDADVRSGPYSRRREDWPLQQTLRGSRATHLSAERRLRPVTDQYYK